jgi:hypothetical protein
VLASKNVALSRFGAVVALLIVVASGVKGFAFPLLRNSEFISLTLCFTFGL